MHSLPNNLANVSDEKGSPLSVERLLGYPYCEMSWLSLLIMVSLVFVVTLKTKLNLLNILDTDKYSLLLNWKNSVVRSCHGVSDISHGMRG